MYAACYQQLNSYTFPVQHTEEEHLSHSLNILDLALDLLVQLLLSIRIQVDPADKLKLVALRPQRILVIPK